MKFYILRNDHSYVEEPNHKRWGEWFGREDKSRVVAKTTQDTVSVSTVFLGLDHNFGEGRPLLFETLVFGGPHDGEMDRYTTWEEAEAGHKEMCKKVGIGVS